MLDDGKVFVNMLKESCLQWFKDHLHFLFSKIPMHFLFSKIPMHLQKVAIHDMEFEFGIGWSIKR